MKKGRFHPVIISLLFVTIALFALFLEIYFLTPCANKNKDYAIKEEQWQAMAKEVDSWVDGLGMPIDPGIKKAIIVLNLLGFKTCMSCQGHSDSGLAYPWIDFALEDAEIIDLRAKSHQIHSQIEEQLKAIHQKYPELSLQEALKKEPMPERLEQLYKENHAIYAIRERKQALKLLPLNNLITDFYKKHPLNPDRMLIFYPLSRLVSAGTMWQITRDEQEKEKKLQEYQDEMNQFADFLTDYYFKKAPTKWNPL